MSGSDVNDQDTGIYKVVINHEEQYSIWPEHRENPRGWSDVGVSGKKAECLAYIDSVWTDMRPLSVRKAMAEAASAPAPVRGDELAEPPTESLPLRLSGKRHPVELRLGRTHNVDTLLRALDTGYVHVCFTTTRGGTNLAVPLEVGVAERIKTQAAAGSRRVEVAGRLTLDDVSVRCVADIDLATLIGTGKLELSSP